MTDRAEVPHSEPPAEEPPLSVAVVPEVLHEAREIMLEVNYWGERADLKAAILMASMTAAVLGEVSALRELGKGHGSNALRLTAIAFLAASIALLLGSAVLAASSIYPRLGAPYEYAEGLLAPGDLVYFGRLRKIPPARIAEGLAKAVADRNLIDHYAEQIHRNAAAAWKKHRLLQYSLRMLGAAAVLAVIGLVCWGIVAV
jgi:hypothetical protein